jgi:hypothetical protein
LTGTPKSLVSQQFYNIGRTRNLCGRFWWKADCGSWRCQHLYQSVSHVRRPAAGEDDF